MTLLLLLRENGSGTESITVTEPQAADRVLVGENVTIDATAVGTSGTVDILLSIDNGATFPITLATGETLPYVWVPTSAQLTAQAVVRVRDADDALIVDDSGVFVVATTSSSGTFPTATEIAEEVWDHDLQQVVHAPESAADMVRVIWVGINHLVLIFAGITSIADWLRRAFRKDSGTAGMATAETEINTGGTATFAGTTDSLEAIKDAGGGGGGSGDATLEKQEEILDAVQATANSIASIGARLQVEVQIQGFPAVICRNTDYVLQTESEIRLTILDLLDEQVTDIAGVPLDEVDWLFGMGSEANPAIIDGAVTWDDTTSEMIIQLLATETASKPLGSITWQIGASIGDGGDPEVVRTRWLGGGTTRLIERHF